VALIAACLACGHAHVASPSAAASPATPPKKPAETIEGSVIRRDSGALLAGARIKLEQPGMDPLYTRADSTGHFDFPGLPAGDYSVTVELPGFMRSADETFWTLPIPISTRENQPVPVGVKLERQKSADGMLRVTATISLFPVATISGRVTDPDGTPLPGTRVEIYQKRSSQAMRSLADGTQVTVVAEVTADDRGEFRASRLLPGAYFLLATPDGPRDLRPTYYPHAPIGGSAEAIELAAGQQARADLRIIHQAGVRVAGRILGLEGVVPESRKLLYPTIVLVPLHSVRLDKNGQDPVISGDRFEFPDILPGRYTLHAMFRKQGSQPPVFGGREDVQIGGRNVNDLTLEVHTLPAISGVVEFAEGCSAVPVKASAWVDSPLMQFGSGYGAVDAEGKFTIASLPAGKLIPSLGSTDPSKVGPPLISLKIGDRVISQGVEYPGELTAPFHFLVGCPQPRRTK
jgi:Carboxypeptidase regulatory-like domain